jgi:hypothetical protein
MPAMQHHVANEVLLFCARRELAPEQLARLRELVGENPDWEYFYKLVRRHSLVPLVSSQLHALVEESVPPGVLRRFRKDYQENSARNIIFADELVSMVEALARAGVEAITFKGPALAITAYGDLSLRRFVDLDVIVRRADVARAIEVLSERGYTMAKNLSPQQQSILLQHQHNLQYTRGRLIVELHWQVASELFASSVTGEELWRHLVTVRIADGDVKTLPPDDLLFALCVHGSRHLWQRLAWICDIDRVIATQPQLDWTSMLARADKAKARRMFLLGPALAAKLLGTQLPEAIAGAISSDRRVSFLANEIQTRLFDEQHESGAGVADTFRYNMLVRSDWRSRFRYLRFALALTDSDLEGVRLSPRFHFFYYLLRPFRLARGSRSSRTAG